MLKRGTDHRHVHGPPLFSEPHGCGGVREDKAWGTQKEEIGNQRAHTACMGPLMGRHPSRPALPNHEHPTSFDSQSNELVSRPKRPGRAQGTSGGAAGLQAQTLIAGASTTVSCCCIALDINLI